MRQIGTGELHQERKKNTAKYIALFMLLILVFSTVGYAFFFNPDSNNQPNGNSDNQTVNTNLKIQQYGDKWAVPFRWAYMYLSNSPENVSDVYVNISRTLDSYYSGDLYMDIKNASEYSEVSTTLGKYVSKIQPACYGSCTENIPEKDCSVNMIVFREGKINKVSQKDNCIFIDGDMTAVDAFIYKIFNINSQSF